MSINKVLLNNNDNFDIEFYICGGALCGTARD